jgi:myo-inositol-1-phosphate synthase
MSKIKVGVIGVGNCAKSLVEGVQYYNENPNDHVGLMYPDIGGYSSSDVEFVIGFDVDRRKVNRPLIEALRATPNCAMNHVEELVESGSNTPGCVTPGAMVYSSPTLDGVAEWMEYYPEEVSFRVGAEAAKSFDDIVELIRSSGVEVLVNYLPVGSEKATRFYVDVALKAGVHFVNCIPTLIETKETQQIEQKFINAGLTFVGSDMRSAWGASRLSEVLQGAMIDGGLHVTYHTQTNRIGGATQGREHIRNGVTSNTDFINMAEKERLHNKHISKENVLKGQNTVRGVSYAGDTLYAGPSLTVLQKPGGEYVGSDNKIADLDIVAFGFGGARYTLQARLSCQDSPNSGGVVISAIRFCRVASEMGIVGILRGPSAYTQKTPPVQLTTSDAKFECDALARRELTNMTRPQLASAKPKAKDLLYTYQDGKTDYE